MAGRTGRTAEPQNRFPTADDRDKREDRTIPKNLSSWALVILSSGGGSVWLVGLRGCSTRSQALPVEVLAFCLLLALGVALRARAAAPATALLFLLLGALVLAPQDTRRGCWVLDDAYISFRYARNALAGDGCVQPRRASEATDLHAKVMETALFTLLVLAATAVYLFEEQRTENKNKPKTENRRTENREPGALGELAEPQNSRTATRVQEY